MPKNNIKTKKQDKLWYLTKLIPKFKNIKLFWQNLKFAFLNLLPKLYSTNEP